MVAVLLTVFIVLLTTATAEEAQSDGTDRVLPNQTGAANHQVPAASQGPAGVLRGGQGRDQGKLSSGMRGGQGRDQGTPMGFAQLVHSLMILRVRTSGT